MAGSGAQDLAPDEAARRVVAEVGSPAGQLRPGGGQPLTPVTAATHLEADLGFDSLTVAELLVRVEVATGRRLPDAALADVATVADLVDRVVRQEGGEALRGAAGEDAVGPGDAPEPAPATVAPTGDERPLTAYGLYAFCVFGLLGLVGWLLVATVPGVERRWRVVRAVGRVLFALTGTRLRVLGEEHLPPEGAYVVAANHPSFLDPLVVSMVLPFPVTFTAVEGLQDHALIRSFLHRLRVELVPRLGDRRRGVAAAGVLTRKAALGRRLVFFPEGRRSTAVGLERFRMGAFVVATDAGVPVVPIAVRGTRAILPVGARWPRRGDVEIEIGTPVAPTGSGFEAALELHHGVRAQILRACDEPDLGQVTRG
jgi:1-acyl-sn-glycerol-3-phosphate acyltransferase